MFSISPRNWRKSKLNFSLHSKNSRFLTQADTSTSTSKGDIMSNPKVLASAKFRLNNGKGALLECFLYDLTEQVGISTFAIDVYDSENDQAETRMYTEYAVALETWRLFIQSMKTGMIPGGSSNLN